MWGSSTHPFRSWTVLEIMKRSAEGVAPLHHAAAACHPHGTAGCCLVVLLLVVVLCSGMRLVTGTWVLKVGSGGCDSWRASTWSDLVSVSSVSEFSVMSVVLKAVSRFSPMSTEPSVEILVSLLRLENG